MFTRHLIYISSLIGIWAGQLNAQEFWSGAYDPAQNTTSCVNDQLRIEIQDRLNTSIEELRQQGRLSFEYSRSSSPIFSWPVKHSRSSGYANISAISSHVDHNPAPGSQDFACGLRSYDGHTGTDIFPWPFPWTAMDSNWAEVVAAAPGTIVLKQDGYDDRECDGLGSGWNAVFVMHSDGSMAWYGHLKAGSVTAKEPGQSVIRGEYLGIIGSSGNSTGPHLHFEIRDSDASLIDPYSGPCNHANRDSWWEDQPDYRTSAINAVIFHDALPELSSCDGESPERMNSRSRFYPGEEIILGVYLRDPRTAQKLNIAIRKPNGALFKSFEKTIDYTANAGYEIMTMQLNRRAELGNWTVQVQYQDQTLHKVFKICASEDICLCPVPQALQQREINSNAVSLRWNGSPEAEEYQIRVDVDSRPSRNFFQVKDSLQIGELPDAAKVSWRVRARCGYLNSDWSGMQIGRLTVELPEVDSLPPSPPPPARVANGWRWKGERGQQLALFDLHGQQILITQGEELNIPFGLPAGIYVLEKYLPDGRRQYARVFW